MNASADGLVDRIIAVIDDDGEGLADESKYLVLAALDSDEVLAETLGGRFSSASGRPSDVDEPALEPVGAFLKSIDVSGFRGIGRGDALQLHPAPGLTVVAGRNGSGKSTFAEALEVALTSTSYRWSERSAGWQRNWANLHEPWPRQIRVEIAEEGAGTTTIGVDWPATSERFDDLKPWVQRPGRKREDGLRGLGWTAAIDLYRPILSYEELGGLLTAAPSKLYDALVAILGLDRVTDAQLRLDTQLKRVAEPVKRAKAERTELKKIMAGSVDERAVQASALLRKHTLELDALRGLAVGLAQAPAGTLVRLQEIAERELPEPATVTETIAKLRAAVGALANQADTATELAGRRLAMLQQAVDLHAAHGAELFCPICGQGTLDAAWRTRVDAELATEAEEGRRLAEARRNLTEWRAAANRLIAGVSPIGPVPGIELRSLDRAHRARAVWVAAPTNDAALADHMSTNVGELHVAMEALRVEAATAWKARQDAWTPLASRLAAWIELAEQAHAAEPGVDRLQQASTWLRKHAEVLRNQLLEPLADEARTIWAALRQESNVDLGAITLPSSGSKLRRVEIAAEVDGADAGALAVMSTGELHALALALFLPRATRPESPFRFVVLDDPIQAMDPSKIDGFVRVLAELAGSRQVVVFSHDDRLPEAVRRLVPAARIIEVTRAAGSLVTLDDACDPAQRDIDDARALAYDPQIEPEIRRRVIPRLCRSAIETAARDAWFARAFATGWDRHAVEQAWNAAQSQRQRIALALEGEPDKSVDGWVKRKPHRGAALAVAGGGNHQEVTRDAKGVVRDVEALVRDVRAGAR